MYRPRLTRSANRGFRSARLAVLLAVTAAASACGGNSTSPLPTGPTPTAVTETFDGTLTVNGATTYPFPVQQTGTVVATLTALDPSDGVIIGLSLGTWNGLACQIVIANDTAVLNVTVTGAASATGNYCARVYDVGTLTAPVAYQISITHF